MMMLVVVMMVMFAVARMWSVRMAVTMHVVMIAQAGVRMVMLCGQLLCRR
jgi:hypothetical protein